MVTNNAIFLLSDFDYLSQKQDNFFYQDCHPALLMVHTSQTEIRGFIFLKKIV